VTDAGLGALAALPALEEVGLFETKVTAAGAAALAAGRPRLKVDR
jgi:hypothetical protein